MCSFGRFTVFFIHVAQLFVLHPFDGKKTSLHAFHRRISRLRTHTNRRPARPLKPEQAPVLTNHTDALSGYVSLTGQFLQRSFRSPYPYWVCFPYRSVPSKIVSLSLQGMLPLSDFSPYHSPYRLYLVLMLMSVSRSSASGRCSFWIRSARIKGGRYPCI